MIEFDEIITFFDNKAIICGSICDLIYINYAGKINDYDFLLEEADLLKSFNLEKHQDEIIMHSFTLKFNDSRSFGTIKYSGHYKSSKIDLFLNDSTYTDTGTYIDISSTHFLSSSKILNYKMQDKNTRMLKFKELRVYLDTLVAVTDWRADWKVVKEQQLKEKLPLYYKI